MSDLYPIWCPTCAKQSECHIGDTVPKCYEPKQAEPQYNAEKIAKDINRRVDMIQKAYETMSCQECKYWIFDTRWGWFCPLKGQDECKYEPKPRTVPYKYKGMTQSVEDEPQETNMGLPGPCIGCDKHICAGCDFQEAKEAWRIFTAKGVYDD